MFINSSIVCALIPELKEDFLSSQIKKFKLSPDQKELLILARKGRESKTLLFSAHPEYCRMTSLTQEESGPFQGWALTSLFSSALDTNILDIEQIDFDRVIKFCLEKQTELEKIELELIFELTGRNANAILVHPSGSKFGKKSGMILDSLKKIKPAQSRVRQILPGVKYNPPPAPKKRNPLIISKDEFKKIILQHPEENPLEILTSHFMGIDDLLAKKTLEESVGTSLLKPSSLDILWKGFQSTFDQISKYKVSPHLIFDPEKKPVGISLFDLSSISEKQKLSFPDLNQALNSFFALEIEKNKEIKKQQKLLGLVQKRIERLKKTEKKLKDELYSLQEAKNYKKFGDLIFSHLKKIRKGTEFVELPDFFVPDHKRIEIKLDPSLSPKKNAEAYYKKYRKAQSGVEELKKRINLTEREIKDLENISLELQKGEKLDLEKIEPKLSSLGLLKVAKPKLKKKKQAKYSPREFISADGWRVLVGRNNRENDYLTFKIAQPEDLWFHAQNTAGSHVVLRKGERKKHPTPKAKEQAASLAAYYSQAKSSKKVSVIYTLVKYVKKPKGAPAGLVKVEKMKSILVEPRLIKQKSPL